MREAHLLSGQRLCERKGLCFLSQRMLVLAPSAFDRIAKHNDGPKRSPLRTKRRIEPLCGNRGRWVEEVIRRRIADVLHSRRPAL